jgi:NAD(P)-dependent dehydrogenase (short-subunit alcohol dehydrogenase family)
MTDSPRLANRVALVTGASRGIGRAVAVGLAREGAHVVLLARTTAGLEEVDDEIRAAGGTATLVTLDLRKPDKVDALGPTLYQRWGKLDILVANAGVLGPISPLPHITADAWNEVIDINLTANWRLIRSLDPLLRRADAARAVFVSSGAASGKNAYWGPYAVSKAGLEALVKTYAHEVASTAIKVNLLNPGPVRTTMRQRAYPGENPDTLPAPEALVAMFLDLLDVGQSDSGQVYNFRQAQ